MHYTDGFKRRMVQRLSGRNAISALQLSGEVGVPQSTLSRWLRITPTLVGMDTNKPNDRRAKGKPSKWTAEEKLRVLSEAASLSGEELGGFLRAEGLHMAQIDEWREQAEKSLSTGKKTKRRGPSAEQKRIKELEAELRRKEKALAEVTALLVLQKKVHEIWGDEDESTPTKRGT